MSKYQLLIVFSNRFIKRNQWRNFAAIKDTNTSNTTQDSIVHKETNAHLKTTAIIMILLMWGLDIYPQVFNINKVTKTPTVPLQISPSNKLKLYLSPLLGQCGKK